jgi:peptidoglycan/LPS O-acetylase OafA/YrhL
MGRANFSRGIAGLRAIAVISVLLFHAGFQRFAGGFVGVDVFFVISGFLITRLIMEEVENTGSLDFSGFYVRRARRLFPALFVTLVGCFAAAFLLFTAQHFQRFGGELLYSSISLSNMFFWNESGYFDTASSFKPLLHTWSLSVEEQFYLIWPLTLVLLTKKTGKRGVWAFLAIASALSLFASWKVQNGYSAGWVNVSGWLATRLKDGASTIFYLTPFRLFEFAIGAAFVWIKPSRRLASASSEAAMAAGLALIAYAVFRYDHNTIFPSYNALAPCLGAAFVIWADDAKFLGFFVRNKVAVFIGEISYSLYLVHWPIFVFYKYWKIVPISEGEKIGLVIAALAAACFMYKFVETPFRGRSRPVRLSRAGVGFACSALLLAVSVCSATVWANDGFPWRIAPMPPDIAAQAAHSKQFQVDQYGGYGFGEPTAWIGSPTAAGGADFVFIGDSHAGQYKTGFQDAITTPLHKSVFFSTSSCLVLPGMTRLTPGTDWDTLCPKALSDALEVIAHSPNAPVFIAESWDFQIANAALLTAKSPILVNQDFDSALKVVKDRLDALRGLLGAHRLVLVGEVPGAGVSDPVGCFMRPKYVRIDCTKIASTPENGNPASKINTFLQAYAAQHRNVSFVNPFTALCDGATCRTLENGRVLYSDDYHLSKVGSRIVVSALKGELLGTQPGTHSGAGSLMSSR